MADATFEQFTLDGYSGAVSALQWGPDGKLYVTERFGDVKVLTVELIGNEYTVTSTDTISLVADIPNHDDDGSLSTTTGRQVTGIVVGGTADDVVIYVSSSDPRIGAGGGGQDKDLDTNSGIISRLTNDGSGWEKVDIVRGLPRSEENHASNGMELSADGNTLYLAQGGHTNAGAPSNNFAGQPEYAYSAAILSVDLVAIDAMAITSDPGGNDYIYDLPTLDDPDRPNDGTAGNENADGSDVSGPFGGNDGFNMAKIEADSPVQVYSPGYRNPYDILLTEDGNLFTYDNGANNGWGGIPLDADGNHVTDPSVPSTNQAHNDDDYNPKNYDQLHLVTEGSYGGHPNAVRAEGSGAGLLLSPNSGITGATYLPEGDSRLPADFDTVVATTNPEENVYQEGGYDDTALDTGQGSVNGLAEYTASTLWDDGAGGTFSIQGAILATDYNGDVYIIPRDGSGAVNFTRTGDGRAVADGKQVIDLNGGGGPLGIDAVGDGEPFAGTIWVGTLGNGSIQILAPGDTSVPIIDIDNDGINNTLDAFALDADNGTGTEDTISGGEVVEYPFESGSIANTFGGAGFTGAMTDGVRAFEDGGLFDENNIIAGGAGGVVQFKSVSSGDAYQGANSQNDALHFGVTLDDSVGTADITLTMTNWIPQATSSGGFPSAGLTIGTGGQDDYIKLVIGARGNTGGSYNNAIFEWGQENDGGASFASASVPALLDASNATWVQLRLSVDTATGTITPLYRFGIDTPPLATDDAPAFTSGASFTVPAGSDLLKAIQGEFTVEGQASGLAVGLVATSTGGTPFTADFDGIVIEATEVAPTTTADPDLSGVGTDGFDRVIYTGTEDVVVPDNIEVLDLSQNGNAVNVTGGSAVNLIIAGSGINTFTGGGAADTFQGSAANLNGDTITDFAEDDQIVITNVDGNATIESVGFGSAVLNIDSDGDGTADTTVTLTGAEFDDADNPADAGDFAVSVVDGMMTITYAPVPDEGVVVRAYNTGGPALTQDGIDFEADTAGAPAGGRTGGLGFTDSNSGNGQQPVFDGTVYETEIYGTFSYAIPGLDASKEYTVELLFAEIFQTTSSSPQRLMDVSIEGELVLDDYSVLANNGGNINVPTSYLSGPVTIGANGVLDIDFVTVADNAKVSGVIVRELGGSSGGDTTAPSVTSVTIVPPPAGDSDAIVTVVYEDAGGVSLASIGAEDIAVTGAGATGPITLDGSEVSIDGNTLTVTYAVGEPVGGWTDGAYSVEVLAGEVLDEAGNGNASFTQGFDVQTTTADVDYIAINAGGPQIVMNGITFEADNSFIDGEAFTDDGGGNGLQPTFDGTIYETERNSGPSLAEFTYSIDVSTLTSENGLYDLELHFAELYQDAIGARIMDVFVEGNLVAELDDLDIVERVGADADEYLDTPYVYTVEGIDPGANTSIDVTFVQVANRSAVTGLVVRAADPVVPVDTTAPTVTSVAVDEPMSEDGLATVTVVYDDVSGISEASLGASDIVVAGAGEIIFTGAVLSNADQTLTATYTVAAPAAGWLDGTYTVDVVAGEVADNADPANTNATASLDFGVDLDPTAGLDTQFVVGINAGGAQYTRASDGAVFEADTVANNHPFLSVGLSDNKNFGGVVAIANTDDDVLYHTERWGQASASTTDADDGNFGYGLKNADGTDLADGTYIVRVHLAETYGPNLGDDKRELNITINGEVIEDYDIFQLNGASTAVVIDRTVTLSGGEGVIDVSFSQGSFENPKVNAVELQRVVEEPPFNTIDTVNGVAVAGDDFSDDFANPTDVALALGSNVIEASQADGADLDYITVTVAEGQLLTAINLTGFVQTGEPNNLAFVGLQEGSVFTAPQDTNPADLLGGALYDGSNLNGNLLDLLADGTVQGSATMTFDAPLEAGDYTFWFRQGQDATKATLDFVVEEFVPEPLGAVTLTINANNDNVQISNFGNNSFVLSNVGEKVVASVVIDVTNALYPDSVFDPFGVAGDTTTKALTINAAGGTGVVTPSGTSSTDFSDATATYYGAGGILGFEGIRLNFDTAASGGFQNGESVGFAVDMDPNSIAGAQKSTLDGGSNPDWDVGGISGAELIGTTFTVTFTDGTTATGQLHSDTSQGGSQGIASTEIDTSLVDVALTIGASDTAPAGTYDESGPTVIVSGTAGETARVVLTKGIIQPTENNFTGDYGDQLQAQLDALAASPFPANNAAEFQVVDVLLDGTQQDITALFDFTQIANYDIADERVALGFTAAIIDTANGGLPISAVQTPTYLTFETNGLAPDGAYLPNTNGDFVFEVEDAGLSDQDGWIYKTAADESGHEAFTGDGYYLWEGGNSFNSPGNGVLSYEFTADTSGTYYVNLRSSREATSTDATEENDAFTRILQDGVALQAEPQGSQDPVYTGGATNGWLKTYQSGGQTTDWQWASRNVDNVGINIGYELVAGETYTFQISGRSNGFEIDRVHLTTSPNDPAENAPLSPRFNVVDVDPPVAVLTDPADISTLFDQQTVTVSYTDANLDETTIDVSDVVLTAPDGVTQIAATSFTSTVQPDGSVVVDYLFDAPAGGFATGEYTATLADAAVADLAGNVSTTALETFTVSEPQDDAQARVLLNAASTNINASTFSTNSISIENESGSGQRITSITIDLSGSILPSMVFDPVGDAGDTLGKGFVANSNAALTGLLTISGATGSPPFSVATGNNGYEQLTIDFSDFDVGETFGFSVDIDPTSIEGADTTGFAGSVSGLELAGSTVTVEFSDGTSYSSQVFADNGGAGGTPSQGGGETVVRAGLLAAPLLMIDGVDLADDAKAEARAALVFDDTQTIQIDGGSAAAGQTVRVLVMEGTVGTEGLANPQDATDDLGTFGANSAILISSYDVVLDDAGLGSVEVTLTDTNGNGVVDGRNFIQAAIIDGAGDVASGVSDTIALRYEEIVDQTVVGTPGDDPLDGGRGNDTIEGFAGDDVITGGDGFDQALYAGNFEDFIFDQAGNGTSLSVTDGNVADGLDEGTDTVAGDVEELIFGDGVTATLGLDGDRVNGFTAASATGAPVYALSLLADGDRIDLDYEDGVLVSRLFTDGAMNDTYSTFEATFSDGLLTGRAIVYDNNDRFDEVVQNGSLVSRLYTDGAENNDDYATYEITYTDGQASGRTIISDTGDRFDEVSEDGAVVSRLYTDLAMDNAYETYEFTYTGGQLSGRSIVSDDGDRFDEVLNNGSLVSRLYTDGAENNGYETLQLNYADGMVSGKSILFDDGDQIDEFMENGVLSMRLYTDGAENDSYETLKLGFTDGQISERSFVYDDGDEFHEIKENGAVVSRLYTDGAMNNAYDTYQFNFEGGQLSSTMLLYDNTDTLQTSFDAGVRTQSVVTDNSDTRGWFTATTTYDTDGSVISTVYQPDFDMM